MSPRAALLVLLLIQPPGAAAQHPGLGPGDPGRALHLQLALADAAAIGTVDAVGLGRIRVRDARPVLGTVPDRFELKRAPSKPPRLHPGSRILLLLTGARSPYLLVPTAEEVVRLPDAEAETRWRRALREVEAMRARPAGLMELYLSWLTESDAELNDAGSLGLRDPDAPFRPLPPDRIAWLVDAAMDATRTSAQRRATARVAVSQVEGADALVSRLPGAPGDIDPELLTEPLRRAALLRSTEVGPALARCLVHPDPDVRRAALAFGSLLSSDEASLAAVEQMATDDPVPDLQQAASRIVQRAKRRTAEK